MQNPTRKEAGSAVGVDIIGVPCAGVGVHDVGEQAAGRVPGGEGGLEAGCGGAQDGGLRGRGRGDLLRLGGGARLDGAGLAEASCAGGGTKRVGKLWVWNFLVSFLGFKKSSDLKRSPPPCPSCAAHLSR